MTPTTPVIGTCLRFVLMEDIGSPTFLKCGCRELAVLGDEPRHSPRPCGIESGMWAAAALLADCALLFRDCSIGGSRARPPASAKTPNVNALRLSRVALDLRVYGPEPYLARTVNRRRNLLLCPRCWWDGA